MNAGGLAWADLLLVFLMALISAITVAGNLVVLLSFFIDRQIRQPSNFFIASLAVSDLIIGLEGIPVYTYFLVNGQRWPFGAFLCDLWLSVDYACCLASIYTVLGITADRYLSVKFPAAYRNWRTKRRVLLIIAGIWIIPSLLFSISIFGYGWFSGKGRILREDECYVQFMTNSLLNMGMYISYYWSTLALMLYLYYGIYSAAKHLATKSDQKQRRLALLAEMRPNGGGGGKEEDYDHKAGEPVSEVLATPQEDSDSTRPTRRASARLLQALQNGRLMALRKNAVCAREKPAAEGNRSTSTLTNQQTGESRLPAEDRERIAGDGRSGWTDAAGGRGTGLEASASASTTRLRTEVEPEPSSGAFSPDFGDESLPFIDESACSSQHEPADSSTGGGIRPSPSEYAPPSDWPPPPSLDFALCSSLELFVPADPSHCAGSEPVPPLRHHSVRVDVHIQREMVSEGLSSGVRRWLGAMGGRTGFVQRKRGGRRRQQPQQRRAAQQQRKASKSSQSRSENRARKALRTITVILGTFTLFWTPFYVLATVYGFCERCSGSPGFQALYTVSYYLCYMNSPINPLCYAAANQQFKRTFKRILRGDLYRN